MDPYRFLRAVWGRQPQEGYGTIAHKDYATSEWREHYLYSTRFRVRGNGTDMYFTPRLSTRPDRRAQHMMGSRWLQADLDEVDPRDVRPMPTLAWETSPGRFQALWLLNRALRRPLVDELNQQVVYFIGADRDSWAPNKVLRIPGSISTKHGEPFRVRLLSLRGGTHRYEDVAALVRHTDVSGSRTALVPDLPTASYEARDVLKKYRRNLQLTVRRYMAGPRPKDRSRELYYLYPHLFHIGLTPEEVWVLLCESVLCKRGPRWMWQDVCKGHARFMESQR